MSEAVIDYNTLIALIGLFFAVVGIWLPLRLRPRKLVTYRILTEGMLLSVSSELKDKLEIFYDGKKITNAILAIVQYTNAGNKEITEELYAEPISISFSDKAQILSADIIDYKPKKFPMSFVKDDKSIVFSKETINQQESFTVKIIFSDVQRPVFNGRIAGGKFQQFIPKRELPDFPFYVLFMFFSVCFFGILLALAIDNDLLGAFSLMGMFLFAIIAAIIGFIQIFDFVRSKLKKQR